MKIEEFEKKTANNAHKSDVLQLVNKGIELANLKGDEKEKWYDDCAKLYENSNGDFVNFKLCMSKRLDTLRFTKYTIDRQNADYEKVQKAFYNALVEVEKFAERTNYNEKSFINDVTKAVINYEQNKHFLQDEISVLEDCLNIIQLKETDWDLRKIMFTTGHRETDKSYHIKSKRTLDTFQKAFIQYFTESFVEETDLDKIQNKIDVYKNDKKRLLHRLIFEIYLVFAKANLTEFSSDKDIYKIGIEEKGKYVSLKGDISVWIFELLNHMGYLDKKRDKNIMNHKNKVDYIKDKMREHSKYKWEVFQLPKDWVYFL